MNTYRHFQTKQILPLKAVDILGSGMDMPLIALKKLFGDKAHLVKYLPLVSKTLKNSAILQNPEIHLDFCWTNILNLRNNSEKDKVARQFLSENHEAPKQQLGCNNINLPTNMHAKLFKVKQLENIYRSARTGPAMTYLM